MGDFRAENAVPYVVHEAAMARAERIIRRLWVLALVLVLLLVASNVAWLWYEGPFEGIVVTQEAENDGGDIALNGVGDMIFNGESETDN